MPDQPRGDEPAGQEPDTRHREPERDERTGRSAAAERIRHQTQWVEQQIQAAQRRGEFDGLPGAGKPIDLGEEHDPDWWLKKLVEREQISVLPPALQVRKDDAELDDLLDRQPSEKGVRREVEDFNERVLKARIQPLGGPPMITQPRDVDAEVQRWRERRDERRARQRAVLAAQEAEQPRRWWQGRRRRS